MQMDIPTKSIQTAAVDALDNENTVVHVALVLGKTLTQRRDRCSKKHHTGQKSESKPSTVFIQCVVVMSAILSFSAGV